MDFHEDIKRRLKEIRDSLTRDRISTTVEKSGGKKEDGKRRKRRKKKKK